MGGMTGVSLEQGLGLTRTYPYPYEEIGLTYQYQLGDQTKGYC